MKDRIDIGYIAKVEGEAGLRVEISGKNVTKVMVDVWEPPRFFEGFLVGRKYDEAPDLVSRICGICPVSHMTTTILALENAMGIIPTQQTKTLRKLLSISQLAASHLVHLYVLALPDYVGCESIMSMLPDHSEEFERFLRIKDVLNRLTGLIGGRALHPVTHVVNGFTSVPRISVLKALGKELESIRDDASEVARLFGSFDYPEMESEATTASLASEHFYFDTLDTVLADNHEPIPLSSYNRFFAEEHAPPSNAKRSTLDGKPFRVGALARINHNIRSVSERARDVAAEIGFDLPDQNPFHNNIAQALEIVEAIEECISIIDGIGHLERQDRSFDIRGGTGAAITEAPRGLLHYEYTVDERGGIQRVNIVTPTSHQILAMEVDAKNLAQSMIHSPRQEIEDELKKLVRAYDPCFSCSVHVGFTDRLE